jgi:hypothetical protein
LILLLEVVFIKVHPHASSSLKRSSSREVVLTILPSCLRKEVITKDLPRKSSIFSDVILVLIMGPTAFLFTSVVDLVLNNWFCIDFFGVCKSHKYLRNLCYLTFWFMNILFRAYFCKKKFSEETWAKFIRIWIRPKIVWIRNTIVY